MPFLLFVTALAAQEDASALIEALRSDSIERRDEAARALTERGAAALPALQRAARDPDPELAGRARRIIQVIHARRDLPPSLVRWTGFEERLVSGHPRAWTDTLLEALRGWAAQGPRAGIERSDLDALAAGALREAASAEDQVALLGLIERARLWVDPASLRPLLKSEDSRARSATLRCLAVAGDPEATADILALLKTSALPDLVENGAHALGELRSREAVPMLLVYLRSNDVQIRIATARALGRARAREHAKEIAALLAEGSAPLRQAAARALAEMGAVEQAPALREALSHADASTAAAALLALAALASDEAHTLLLKGLADSRQELREAAAPAAARLRVPGALPALRRVFEANRWTGLRALATYGEPLPEIVLEPLLKDPALGVRYFAACAAPLERALPVLHALAREDLSLMADAAGARLARLAPREGVPLVLERGIDLTVLNACRAPDAWAKLDRPSRRTPDGTVREVVEEIARSSGFQVRWPDTMSRWWNVRAAPEGPLAVRGTGGSRLAEVLDGRYAVVIEGDIWRILTTSEARAYWRAWWAADPLK